MLGISVNDCLHDSPKFRSQLECHESNIDLLEHRLEKVIKICSLMINSGKTYVSHQSLFANSLWEMGLCFREDSSSTKNLNYIIKALQEMNKLLITFLDQASQTVLNNLTVFVKENIRSSKESKHMFEKASSELDAVLLRNSQVLKSRPQEGDELLNLVSSSKNVFSHAALNHMNCITMLLIRKKPEIFSILLSYIQEWCTYFQQGFTLTENLQDFIINLNKEILDMSTEVLKIEKEHVENHKLVDSQSLDSVMMSSEDFENSSKCKDNTMIHIEGYLFKRTSNTFKSWNRRWFILKNNQLAYCKRNDDINTVMEYDLRICTVKPVYDSERRFCFEVLSPSKSHILQADSEYIYKSWIEVLQRVIIAAIQHSEKNQLSDDINGLNSGLTIDLNKIKMSKTLDVFKISGNDFCCDCKAPKPDWSSINLGITLCIECSGIHRSLGVHYSKVRSLTLDDIEPEILKVLSEVGNDVVNEIYEFNVSNTMIRPTSKCQDTVREKWIQNKYVYRMFVKPLHNIDLILREIDATSNLNFQKVEHDKSLNLNDDDNKPNILINTQNNITPSDDSSDDSIIKIEDENISNLGPDLLLYKSALIHNFPIMCHALALGANTNWKNPKDNGRTCLFQAILSGSVMASEYLILNSSDINIQDFSGQTPLFIATQLGDTAQVCHLLKHKANQYIRDFENVEPLEIAIKQGNANVVTLLKLSRLNEEIKNSEHGAELFNDAVCDFSQLSPLHK